MRHGALQSTCCTGVHKVCLCFLHVFCLVSTTHRARLECCSTSLHADSRSIGQRESPPGATVRFEAWQGISSFHHHELAATKLTNALCTGLTWRIWSISETPTRTRSGTISSAPAGRTSSRKHLPPVVERHRSLAGPMHQTAPRVSVSKLLAHRRLQRVMTDQV